MSDLKNTRKLTSADDNLNDQELGELLDNIEEQILKLIDGQEGVLAPLCYPYFNTFIDSFNDVDFETHMEIVHCFWIHARLFERNPAYNIEHLAHVAWAMEKYIEAASNIQTTYIGSFCKTVKIYRLPLMKHITIFCQRNPPKDTSISALNIIRDGWQVHKPDEGIIQLDSSALKSEIAEGFEGLEQAVSIEHDRTRKENRQLQKGSDELLRDRTKPKEERGRGAVKKYNPESDRILVEGYRQWEKMNPLVKKNDKKRCLCRNGSPTYQRTIPN